MLRGIISAEIDILIQMSRTWLVWRKMFMSVKVDWNWNCTFLVILQSAIGSVPFHNKNQTNWSPKLVCTVMNEHIWQDYVILFIAVFNKVFKESRLWYFNLLCHLTFYCRSKQEICPNKSLLFYRAMVSGLLHYYMGQFHYLRKQALVFSIRSI